MTSNMERFAALVGGGAPPGLAAEIVRDGSATIRHCCEVLEHEADPSLRQIAERSGLTLAVIEERFGGRAPADAILAILADAEEAGARRGLVGWTYRQAPNPYCERCAGTGAEVVEPGPDSENLRGAAPCSCIGLRAIPPALSAEQFAEVEDIYRRAGIPMPADVRRRS